MKMKTKLKGFLKRRWSDFKVGDATYWRSLIGLVSFSLIFYEWGLTALSWLVFWFTSIVSGLGSGVFIGVWVDYHVILPTFWHFFILFLLFYGPVASLTGRFHRKVQMSTDISLQTKYHPYFRNLIYGLISMAKKMGDEEAVKIFEELEFAEG